MSENNYVYLHRLVKTNEVFYVGLGRGLRMYSRHGRSKHWKKIVEENEWYYSIVKSDMNREDASNLEVALINIYKPRGNIQLKKTETVQIMPDIEFIRNRYKYDESSLSGLVYQTDNNQYGKKKRLAGQVAGTLTRDRYTVSVNGRNIFNHRVIWCLINNEDPVGFSIDHIDGDSCNNKISNLRKVSNSLNNKNVRLKKNNKTGYKGVTLLRNKYYCSTYTEGEVPYIKHFSIQKFGKELALALAIEYRFRKMKALINSGDMYTERHVGKYFKLPALEKSSEVEIITMFNDDLCVKNKSGKTGISFYPVKNNDFWVVSINRKKINFSVTKFGYDLAKSLAFEYLNRYEGNQPNTVGSYSMQETNSMLDNKTRASNVSGFHGVTFYVQRGVTSARAQKSFNGKRHSKSFNCNEMGITNALHSALTWLKEFGKE